MQKSIRGNEATFLQDLGATELENDVFNTVFCLMSQWHSDLLRSHAGFCPVTFK